MRKITDSVMIVLAVLVVLFLVDGRTTAFADGLPDLSAQWWELMFSIPPDVNPVADTTGAHCMVGQSGPTWFLAGAFSSGSVTRSCSVPAGRSLYFPIVNVVNVNTPNICGQGNFNLTAKQLRAQIAQLIGGATNLSAEVDGTAVANIVRVRSNVFAVALPADNVSGCAPAGVYSPGVDEGFYVRLPPLSLGSHTIHFHGEVPGLGSVEDITYNLTVVATQLK